MKVALNVPDLISALHVCSIVPPKIDAPTGKGYLFSVKGNKCYLYSRDAQRVMRTDFPVITEDATTPVEEGSFIYPEQYVGVWEELKEGTISLEAWKDEKESNFVKYDSSKGQKGQHSTVDPRLMQTCDKDLEGAKEERTFPIGLLRRAIEKARTFVAKPNDSTVADERFKTIRMFDGKVPESVTVEREQALLVAANGHVFAGDGRSAFYFYCDSFKDKGFSLHANHIPFLVNYLAKCGDGAVTIKDGEKYSFAIDDKDRSFGWLRMVKTHERFNYYRLDSDAWVFTVPRATFMSAITCVRKDMESRRKKVRLEFDRERSALCIRAKEMGEASESFPVIVKAQKVPEDGNLVFQADIDRLSTLVQEAETNEIEVRFTTAKDAKGRPFGYLRTIETFYMSSEGKVVIGSDTAKPEGAHKCTVTRFTPSMD